MAVAFSLIHPRASSWGSETFSVAVAFSLSPEKVEATMGAVDEDLGEIILGTHNRKKGRELDQLLGEIDNLQQAQLQSRFEVQHIERFQIFLGLAIAALVLGELIPDRRALRAKAGRVRRSLPWVRRQPQLGGMAS